MPEVVVVPYRCPHCGKVYGKLFSLKKHFEVTHCKVVDSWHNMKVCPVPRCKKKVRSTQGLMMHAFWLAVMGDAEHAVLYYLMSGGTSGGTKKAVRDLAAKTLYVGGEL